MEDKGIADMEKWKAVTSPVLHLLIQCVMIHQGSYTCIHLCGSRDTWQKQNGRGATAVPQAGMTSFSDLSAAKI